MFKQKEYKHFPQRVLTILNNLTNTPELELNGDSWDLEDEGGGEGVLILHNGRHLGITSTTLFLEGVDETGSLRLHFKNHSVKFFVQLLNSLEA